MKVLHDVFMNRYVLYAYNYSRMIVHNRAPRVNIIIRNKLPGA